MIYPIRRAGNIKGIRRDRAGCRYAKKDVVF